MCSMYMNDRKRNVPFECLGPLINFAWRILYTVFSFLYLRTNTFHSLLNVESTKPNMARNRHKRPLTIFNTMLLHVFLFFLSHIGHILPYRSLALNRWILCLFFFLFSNRESQKIQLVKRFDEYQLKPRFFLTGREGRSWAYHRHSIFCSSSC